MTIRRSQKLFRTAQRRIPGGVNSPVRAFKSVGTVPRFIASASGSRMTDVDGNRYIDYVGSWGPMLFGHAHPRIVAAVSKAARKGTSFGAPTELEVTMAEMIRTLVPSVEMVRMVNSGTEATMSAVRLARAYTGREAIIKFEGCYHGHGDSFLIRAGSGAMTYGVPDSPGVPGALAAQTINCRYNDTASVAEAVERTSAGIAAIIVEPVVGNMGCIPPRKGFLESLRRICSERKIVLIFDEVMTGFRVAPGGAQELYGIRPDLTTLGKIIGGGLPVGAYGGRKEIMSMVAPSGPVYQAGTLSGNPLAMAAGCEMLRMIRERRALYTTLEARGAALENSFGDILQRAGIPSVINRVGSMFTVFFTDAEVRDYDSARSSDTERFASYFRAMLAEGIYLPPSQYEAAFISAAHSARDIETTVRAFRKALRLT
ncbi:MAG TPA: glutamate-1-semialdehyde 2,1-aminomutase [Bacteroidota bacterium]|nr:glutamate-1-semialdehyde 2,1-aminomutase [Bacteroidota bacterium]